MVYDVLHGDMLQVIAAHQNGLIGFTPIKMCVCVCVSCSCALQDGSVMVYDMLHGDMLQVIAAQQNGPIGFIPIKMCVSCLLCPAGWKRDGV
jgi:hypothetical protein